LRPFSIKIKLSSKIMRVYVCGAALKGKVFIDGLRRRLPIARVFTYRQADDRSQSFDGITNLCRSLSIPVVESRRPSMADLEGADLVFVVGWQYLLPIADSRLIVFHDSLLPRYRGFLPTVTALIAGDDVVGVTAFHPAEGVDNGPIVAQAQLRLTVPARIDAILRQQAELMVDLAVKLVAAKAAGELVARPQDEGQATYSLWRDAEDYFIDWTWPAEQIQRFVYAVGYPYDGARTMLEHQVVIISDCAAVPDDLRFSIRQPGKVWGLTDGVPSVVCGSGLLRILGMHSLTGSEIRVARLRTRFRNPPEPAVCKESSASNASSQRLNVSRTK
jgi:methionyl-tRNA formyltransferase